MIKIEIKTIYGKVLFEYEKKNNTIRETLIKAVNSGADLHGADLSDAHLRGADLHGADLHGAHLRGADLSDAHLHGADLSDADLHGAHLHGAHLSDAEYKGLKIRKIAVFSYIYKYVAMPIITKEGNYIRLGCYTRSVEEWDKDFWNNNTEFPDNGSVDSELRKLAYKTCKKWIKINSK